MVSITGMGLIGFPIAASVFSTLLSLGAVNLVFITMAAFIVSAAVTGFVALTSGVSFYVFGSGFTLPDQKDWSLKFIFTLTFLSSFYASNVIGGLSLILSMPLGIGLVLTGIFSTMFVFGLFGAVS
jgi:hypothetical protein